MVDNWQHTSYCCELMFALAPRSILDVGMGFGRWGILAREMCDVWRKNVSPDQCNVDITGVAAFGKLVQDYHAAFYDRVIVRDALAVLRDEPGPFDLVVLDDMLERLARHAGRQLLELALEKAFYTMLCIPLGRDWQRGQMNGDACERHRSVWRHAELARLAPVCHRFFQDYCGRQYAVYLLPSGELDTSAYWEGRRRDLVAPSFPELRDLYPGGGPRGTAAALRRYFHSHPRQERAARVFYRVFRLARRRAVPKRPAPEPPPPPPVRAPEVRDDSVPVLAVVPDTWFGVTTSTRNNFPNILPWGGSQAEDVARRILDGGFETVVFCGVPEVCEPIARILANSRPSVRLLIHYQGSFAQNAQRLTRERFDRALRLAAEGVVERIGCGKSGVAAAFRALGVEAEHVPNRVAPPMRVEHRPARSPRRIGVFSRDIFLKNPHTQFMAAAMVSDAEIHAGQPPDLAYLDGRAAIVTHGPLPYEQFLTLLGQMDVNLYVSLTECWPMVVLESLIRGVPCVTSHTHEIFEHDRELGRRLTVDALDNPVAIARKAEEALADREALGRRCAAYALELNRRAEAAINDFVGHRLYPRAPREGTSAPPVES